MMNQKEQDLLKLEGVVAFVEGELDFYDLSEEVRFALYSFYEQEMPYGTAKGRTGDPDQWIAEHMSHLL
jgi:hypothetical protein